ncbi:MAG: branched chain amino acid ABC transporter substrate-binding protein [SAR324 cluster bacterium]|uniref:Branched chain amino acid ABC transporter substrate-binding protein n=1 Tax=SAR324 cluster bacterium TaxID=2024889 RepID=A0A2A4SUB2_9DELT|nr:MAG: branched chain amino acid ABC transporter substrate-binding protein [SAR324 cluster bacterium]
MKKFLSPVIVGLALLTAVAGCDKKEEATAANSPIKIGIAGAFAGDLAPYGIPQKNTINLAVEEINAAGGVLGRQIEIYAEDDACKPETATNVASKLIGEGVVAVIGHTCSGATIAAMSVYRDADIPVISSSATSPALTLGGQNPKFFRTIPHDKAQAELQTKFIVEHLKAKRVAVVHDKGDYGKGLAVLVKEGLEQAGVEIILFEGITPGAVDYSALIRKIARAKPDVIAFGGYHPEGSKIVSQARKKGLKTPFVSGDGLKDPSFIKIAGKYAEGYYVSSPADISTIAKTKEVTAQLKERGQQPGNFGLQTHAAITALVNAIEKAGSTDSDKLAAALRSNTVATTLGDISFDERGDVIGSGFSMYIVKNGDWVTVNY